jgi:hypothetical protein
VRARTRNALTLVSLAYIAGVVLTVGRVPLSTLNILLIVAAGPLMWLIWAFCRWSAYQHSARWAKDIERVHGTAARAERVAR